MIININIENQALYESIKKDKKMDVMNYTMYPTEEVRLIFNGETHMSETNLQWIPILIDLNLIDQRAMNLDIERAIVILDEDDESKEYKIEYTKALMPAAVIIQANLNLRLDRDDSININRHDEFYDKVSKQYNVSYFLISEIYNMQVGIKYIKSLKDITNEDMIILMGSKNNGTTYGVTGLKIKLYEMNIKVIDATVDHAISKNPFIEKTTNIIHCDGKETSEYKGKDVDEWDQDVFNPKAYMYCRVNGCLKRILTKEEMLNRVITNDFQGCIIMSETNVIPQMTAIQLSEFDRDYDMHQKKEYAGSISDLLTVLIQCIIKIIKKIIKFISDIMMKILKSLFKIKIKKKKLNSKNDI